MTRPLILFGAGDIGELAHYYFENDTSRKVIAFTVDGAFLRETTFKGLPVVPFEEVQTVYSPQEHDLFIALSYAKLNQARREKYLAAKSIGYRLPSYVSSKSSVLNDGSVGDNCFILEDNTIQPFVSIGNNVTLWSGNHIGHHSVIHDHCFIASHVVISGGVEIGEACFLGVNATLRDHIVVGENCVIGAGVLLLEDAQPNGVYKGSGTERTARSSATLKRI